jgi:hypothetical protein
MFLTFESGLPNDFSLSCTPRFRVPEPMRRDDRSD